MLSQCLCVSCSVNHVLDFLSPTESLLQKEVAAGNVQNRRSWLSFAHEAFLSPTETMVLELGALLGVKTFLIPKAALFAYEEQGLRL